MILSPTSGEEAKEDPFLDSSNGQTTTSKKRADFRLDRVLESRGTIDSRGIPGSQIKMDNEPNHFTQLQYLTYADKADPQFLDKKQSI